MLLREVYRQVTADKLGQETADAIQEGLAYCGKAFEAIRENARVGMSEIELKDYIDKAMTMPEGRVIDYSYVFSSGPRTALPDILHESENKLEYGQPVFLDIWFRYNGHWVDVCRTFFMGAVSDTARRMYDATLNVISELEKALKPGITGAELFALADQTYSSCGYEGYLWGHVGHRIHTDAACIVPDFRKDGKETVEDGMVLALEPGIQEKGVLGVRVEDNYLMTEKGLLNLFDYPKDLEYFIIK